MKYGRFTIIEEFSDFPYKNAKTKTRMVKVLCDCGNIVIREKRKDKYCIKKTWLQK